MTSPDECDVRSRYDSSDIAVIPKRQTSYARKRVGWIVLAIFLLFLIYRAVRHGSGGDIANVSLWELQDSHQLIGWIGGLVLKFFCEFACFIPVGFITAIVFPQNSKRFCRFPINLQALFVGSALVVFVRTIEIGKSWNLFVIVSLAIPLLGCLFGVWMGTTWLRGWRARLWFLPKIALLVLLVALCMGFVLWLSVEEMPLPFNAASVTSAEKRRLVHLIRSKSPRHLEEGRTHTLRLTDHDINVLLSWGLSLGSPNRKAKVSLVCKSATLSLSVGIPLGEGRTRYINLQMDGSSNVEKGVVRLNVHRCKLGSVKIPRWLLSLLSPFATSLLNHNRLSKPFMDAIETVSIGQDSIAVTYGRVNMPDGFREDIFGPTSAGAELLASTGAQMDHLFVVVSQLPNMQLSFATCFEIVFTFARNRSVERDPVTENRAGIFALGILLGHPRVEEFLGQVPVSLDNIAARRALRRVAVCGRSDWTKHFCVSAAIAILSDEVVSDAAGLLKEELDADIGGSGFSFADLLADRAGTTFAICATRDEISACAMQNRIARGFRVEDFFPPAADLPEGISDAVLQSRYGGVGGEAYRLIIDEIERRIASCVAYR